MSTALLTIKKIKEMPAMVIPGVQGTLVEVKEHKQVQGAKGPTTVQSFKIQEGNDWLFGDAWGMQDLSPWRGQNVIFVSNKTGNNKIAGVQIKEKPSQDGSKTYKNLSISSVATLHDPNTYESSKGVPAPHQQAPVAAQPAPQAQQQAPFVPKPAVTQAPASFAQRIDNIASVGRGATPINGQTVGMALKLAGDFIMAGPEAFDDIAILGARLHSVASMIIITAQRLERGDLEYRQASTVDSVAGAYTPADTAGIESFERAIPQPRSKPTPGPGGSAFQASQDDGEDVPF